MAQVQESGLTKDQEKVLELLKSGNYNATQIANHFRLSREHASRILIYPLRDLGKISKVEATQFWKLTGQIVRQDEIKKQLASEKEFFDCQTIQNMLKATSAQKRFIDTATIRRICMGQRYKGFKINPDAISFPQGIQQIIELEDKVRERPFSYAFRQSIRAFIVNGLKLNPSVNEFKSLGLEGDKTESNLGTLHMKKEQYEKIKNILRPDLKKFVRFIFLYWIGVRPSILNTIKLDDLFFYDRTVKYIEIDGGRITDSKVIQVLKNHFEVKSYTHRACTLKVFEWKTEKPFPKYVWDDEGVKALEGFVQKRKHQGFTYLFYDNNDMKFEKTTYRKVQWKEMKESNDEFKELFLQVGFKKEDFGFFFRANYGMRHFSIQNWCILLNWDYSKIKKMFHEDQATLEKYYGQMTQEAFAKTMDEVLPF